MNKKILLFCTLMISSLCSLAQSSLKEEFLEALSRQRSEIKSISSDFNQTYEISVLMEIQKSSGRFYYNQPNSMKWEQITPEYSAFVFDKQKAFKVEGGSQVELNAANPQVSAFRRFIMGTIDGSIFQDSNFTSEFSKTENDISVKLVPQKKLLRKRFEKIEMRFDSNSLLLQELVYWETGGDLRKISFLNHKLNSITDKSIFE